MKNQALNSMSEPVDRNKSQATHAATAAVAAWMDNMGVKAVESEVAVGQSWIADLAGMWDPTYTELRRSHAFKRLEWLKDVSDGARLPKFYHHMGSPITVLVEVKTDRGDFLKDRGRKYGWGTKPAYRPAPAHLCIIAAPKQVVQDDEAMQLSSAGWGVLQLSKSCDRVSSAVRCIPFRLNGVTPGETQDFMSGLLTSLDHRTRHARLRMWRKTYAAGGGT